MSYTFHNRPLYTLPTTISLPKIDKMILAGGDSLHILPTNATSLIQLEIRYNAGSWHQNVPFEALLTGKMLSEGTKSFNSKSIAETIDYYGGYYAIGVDKDYSSIQFVFPKMHIQHILPILSEIIYESIFLESELHIVKKNLIHNIKQDNQRGDVIANKQLFSMIFGNNHPYGRAGKPEEVDAVGKETIQKFYATKYPAQLSTIFITGEINDSDITLIEKYLSPKRAIIESEIKEHKIHSSDSKKEFLTRKESTQSSIRIGRELFNNHHPDYVPLHIASTVLGGYFGSRLMSNLREDKGFTYGVGSFLIGFKNSGVFGISTEVGLEHTDAAISEIYKEIAILQEKEISDEELNRVKNYMVGTYLKSFDGPFNIMSQYTAITSKGLSLSYPQQYLDTINQITPKAIKLQVNKYLDPALLTLAVVNKTAQ